MGKTRNKALNWFFWILVWLTIGVVVFNVSAAQADDGTKLNKVASTFAMQPVIVFCGKPGIDPILDNEALGYVYLYSPEIFMRESLCSAAEHITDETYPLSRRAIAVLVLIHESYHLRKQWSPRGDEGKTECQAIRHFRVGAMLLGASPELATKLRFYALIFHWQLAATNPEYNFNDCEVPTA